MKTNLLKNTFIAITAAFITLFTLSFTAQAQTTYNLKIAGTQVTSDNCADLSVIEGVSGTVSYAPETNTLTLEDATINATKNAIYSEINGLSLKVVGTNNIHSSESGIQFTQPLTINGGGTLNVDDSANSGIYAEKTDLFIEDCTVNAKGFFYGITGYDGSVEQLIIRNAIVTVNGPGYAAITGFSVIVFEDCSLTAPEGAAFDLNLQGVAIDGALVKENVIIKPQNLTLYHLEVAGTKVTSANCADLSGINGVSGTVSFDPETNTLTLDNATINAEKNAISSNIEELTLKVVGTNNIHSAETGIMTTRALTINGGGTLNVEDIAHSAIYVYTDLFIENCTVNAKGFYYGIAGNEGSVEQFVIINAGVTAEGSYASIGKFNTVDLDGCTFTTPAGAAYDAALKGVALNGELVKEQVVITPQPDATAIDTPAADNARHGIYTLTGIRLESDFHQLPAGVYIVDGRKVVKQ